jgi:hypothetical protein
MLDLKLVRGAVLAAGGLLAAMAAAAAQDYPWKPDRPPTAR